MRLKLLPSWLKAVGRHWIATAITGVAPAVLSAVQGVSGWSLVLGWRSWLLVAAVGVVWSSFLAWHDAVRARDETAADMASRFDEVRFRLVMTEATALVFAAPEPMPPVEVACRLAVTFRNGSLSPIEFVMEHLEFVVGTHTVADPVYQSTHVLVLPGLEGKFSYPTMVVPVAALAEKSYGCYTLRYGHPAGDRWFRSTHRFSLQVFPSPQGTMVDWTTDGEMPSHEPIPQLSRI